MQRGEYDWPGWRKLGSAAQRAEDQYKHAIRPLVIHVERFAWNREASARKAREMWQRHLRDRAAHQLPDATHFPPPTVH